MAPQKYSSPPTQLASQWDPALFEQIPLGITLVDGEGLILRSNAWAERLLGPGTRGGASGWPGSEAWQLLRSDGTPLPREEWPFVVALREGQRIQDRLLGVGRPEGRVIWLSLTATPLDGDLVLMVFTEASERNRAEEERDQFLKFFNTSADLMCIADPKGAFLKTNPACTEILGYSNAELVSRPFVEFILPEDRQETIDEVARQLQRGYSLNFENRYVCKDGSVKWLSWRATYNKDEGLTYATARDMTSYKLAEASIRKYQLLLASIINSQKDTIIFSIDKNYKYLFFNKAHQNSMKIAYNKDVEIGMNILECITSEEDRADAKGNYDRALMGESHSNIRQYGNVNRAYFESHFNPIINDAGEIIGATGLARNITDRLEAEEERRRLESQLQQSQKMESLGSLAGGVAHDMNNILAAILSLASVHQEQAPEGTPLRANMDTIAKACLRGRNLVQGLLSFARKGLSEERILDLNALVREEVALLERTTMQKVRLEVDLEEGIRAIKGDPATLSQALMNLCVNAVDAMPEGGTLTLRSRNEGPGSVLLEVTDTGCGMPKDVLERALDPFFTTKAQGAGTGLGLPIVFRTVNFHRGELKLRSTPGQGTTVTILLPACEEAGEGDPQGAEAAEGVTPRVLRVLVVDDDELIQQSSGRLLEVLGHVPLIVGSGEEALAALEGGLACDMVILDMNMPGLGGSATLTRLRSLRPDLPVLLATGRVDQQAVNLVASVPKVRLLGKPFTLADLRNHLPGLD